MPEHASTPARAVDVAVIGAGPAGLSAALAAADARLTVAVLDAGERIGGQYYRHSLAQASATHAGPLHHGWARFVRLRERFARHLASGRIAHLARHSVWSIERDGRFLVRAVEGELERHPRLVRARAVIVATGAYDRHVPFPGWTLPGVMAGGGAQSLLKGSGVAPGARAVVAGTGPFLLSVADGLLAGGVEVAEVVEANAPWRMAGKPRAWPATIAKLPEAIGYGARLRRHRVPFRTRHAVVAAHGAGRLEAVTIARVDPDWHVVAGTERRVSCDLLAVGYGFTPQIELALAVGCAPTLGADGSVAIAADADGRTSVPGVYAAGESAGIGGADLAIVEGRLCGAAVARDLGTGAGDHDAGRGRLRLRRRALRQFASALHAVHAVRGGWATWLDDETLVCRCEEVSYARVREAVTELGAADARAVKLLARPGMGFCQGRMCGGAVAALVARHRTRPSSLDELTAMSPRTIGQPVPLAHLAARGAAPGPSEADPRHQ